jgi:uncharacterized membrane protein required for colicin V production
MTWFDALVLLIVVGVVLFEARQEAGQGLLDTVATLGAVQISLLYSAPFTAWLGWKPMPEAEVSPGAQLLLFGLCWSVGLLLSRLLHRQTRWSMDHFDLVFGMAFGLMIAVAAGHVVTDSAARMAIMDRGAPPHYMRDSYLVDELRSFRSYHYVLNVFHAAQNGE